MISYSDAVFHRSHGCPWWGFTFSAFVISYGTAQPSIVLFRRFTVPPLKAMWQFEDRPEQHHTLCIYSPSVSRWDGKHCKTSHCCIKTRYGLKHDMLEWWTGGFLVRPPGHVRIGRDAQTNAWSGRRRCRPVKSLPSFVHHSWHRWKWYGTSTSTAREC